MLGILRTDKYELLFKEVKHYQCYYCSVCRELKINYGRFCSLFNSFEAVFISILYQDIIVKNLEVKKTRCTAIPLLKLKMIETECKGAEIAADISMLAAYLFLKDKFTDKQSGKFSNLKMKSLYFLLSKKFQKSFVNLEKEGLKINELLTFIEKQDIIEKNMPLFLEEYIGAFGGFFGYIFEKIFRDDSLKTAGYHLGCIMNLYDSLADFYSDSATGQFNPLNYYFNDDIEKNPMIVFDKIRNIITGKARIVSGILEKKCNFSLPLISNILSSGLNKELEYIEMLFKERKSVKQKIILCNEL